MSIDEIARALVRGAMGVSATFLIVLVWNAGKVIWRDVARARKLGVAFREYVCRPELWED